MPWANSPSANVSDFNIDRIGDHLAFAQSVPDLLLALKVPGAAAVVQAPPGTGKTTLVPPVMANILGATGSNRVIVVQPRRVAARSAARRLAQLSGTRLGQEVGYSVKGDRQAGQNTVIEFLTPGILLRRLLNDPALDGIAGVVLDEVHERSLESDLLMGMLAQVRELRENMTLVAMSATLEAERFAKLLSADGEPVPLVDCPQALYPLEIKWAPAAQARLNDRGVNNLFLDHIVATTLAAHEEALAEDPEVDALIFVPGAREVSYVARALDAVLGNKAEVRELHGQVNPGEQDAAISGRQTGGLPRLVVSTSLAESSLTVPGVRLVIDSGLAREPRRDSSRGMTGLVTVSCSQASSIQRAGRAARLGPGRVVRCFDERSFAQAPQHPTPEILTAELSSAALMLACWGTPGGDGLALPDAPPAAAIGAANELLLELGALEPSEDNGLLRATQLGHALALMPLEPRLARALLVGAKTLDTTSAAQAVALIAADTRAQGADLGQEFARLRNGSSAGVAQWRKETHRLERIVASSANVDTFTGLAGPAVKGLSGVVTAGEGLATIVALAYPERIARRVGDGPSYLLASGTRAALPQGSPLVASTWLAISELNLAAGKQADGTGAVIRAAAAIDEKSAVELAGSLVIQEVVARFEDGRVKGTKISRVGAIVLSSTPVKVAANQGGTAVAAALRKEGLGALVFSPKAIELRRRMAYLNREIGQPWPEVSDQALLSRLDEWLGPELGALASGSTASNLNLEVALSRLLPWPDAAKLEELAPERLQVPSGSNISVAYPDVFGSGTGSERAVVAVKLQECFGLAETPLLAGGRAKILFHLLSPAKRPLAVTDDLKSFWSGPYLHVRSEMRGKYPKHPWPEDPWTAPATSKVKRLM